MNEINVTFTADEANALMVLIDLAVKSAGLQSAEAAVVLSKKLQAAAQAAQAPAAEAAPVAPPK